ncbi:MAG: D-alanine--D-alanine ligase [Clostridiales bacterium]|nr:D-alanine--D-alanine ligase [Clostridiales bacterium]
MEKTTLLVLFGGKSTEHDVSLMSATSILNNVDREKYNVETVGITKSGDWYYYTGAVENITNGSWCENPDSISPAAISPSMSDHALLVFAADGSSYKKIHIDVIFPVMHGAYSEDGTLQGLMQMSGIPFVGCKCATSAISMDKAFTKLILKNFNIPQARSIIVNAQTIATNYPQIQAGCENLSAYPLFVKPANAGSSVGSSKVMNRDMLLPALKKAAEHDSKIIVEEYIKGKECEIAVMGSPRNMKATTIGQIVPGSDFYDYETKYSSGSPATYKIPADIKDETKEALRTTALRICAILGVEGLSRVDFFVRKGGGREEIIFNEINTLPGFTEISMYPRLFVNDGMEYSEIIDHLIDIALGKEA